MISSPIDVVLLGALAFTGWRTVIMARELRALRRGDSELAMALRDADVAINRAAHAVVMLRSEGIEMIAAIDERISAAREAAIELEDTIRVADRKLAVANDARGRVDDSGRGSVPSPQDMWLNIIESRLASGSAGNR